MPLILGGVGALLLIVVLVMLNSKSGGDDDQQGDNQQNQQQQAKPEPKKSAPMPLKTGSAKAGKTPDRPAPTLTNEMLAKANGMIEEAKALNNEGVKLRNGGDNKAARAKQAEAKRKLDECIAFLEVPALWQEEADLEGWAMPAEYVTLGHLYVRIAKYQKRIRMSGGK